MPSANTYDLIVIGTGPAGEKAAVKAAYFGKKVAIIEKEKCYGVVKAGKNDCSNKSKTHSCAGHATVDSGDDEWVLVPKGLCDRLTNGSK